METVQRIVKGAVAFRGYYIPAEARQDVIQEVWVNLCAKFQDGSLTVRNRQELEALVRQIAHRRCVDWIRKEGRSQPLDGEPETDRRPDDPLIEADRRVLVKKVLAALQERCREIIRLCLVDRLSYNEIALRQGRKEAAVRKQWSDCIKRVRALSVDLQTAPRTTARQEP